MSFEISSDAKSYYFPEEKITVVIPPNTLGHKETPCMASITTESPGTYIEDAKSKIFEFGPSGFQSQNRMMVVFPLFGSHSYDYNNMTLMYKENKTSEFIDAATMTHHKPSWLFHRNTCYVFLNHFSCVYVRSTRRGQHGSTLYRDSLLFYKYNQQSFKLKLTFGCYDETCVCSSTEVFQVYIHKMDNILW